MPNNLRGGMSPLEPRPPGRQEFALEEFVPLVPDHELIRRIGQGSYGEVWLARNVVGTYRAVKVVYRKTFSHDRPYEREFGGMQKFEPVSRTHEGLVNVLQIGRNDQAGYFYYIMELADDASEVDSAAPMNPATYRPKTLGEVARHGRLSLEECLQIVLGVTSSLAHLHRNELVHRDIKPSNILIIKTIPKLADIGLVAGINEARSFVGTEGFIAPEGPGKPQADLYSLGKVLYEISTGKDRHDFPDLPADLKDSTEQARFSELNEIILKACASEVAQRYRSAEEMHAELALLQSGKSVRHKRTLDLRWAVCKKAGLVVVMLVSAAAVALTLRALASRSWQPQANQDFDQRGPSSRGPDLSVELGRLDEGKISTNDEANVLYHRAMGIMRDDNYPKLGEAYTNFNEATRLDPNFAKAFAALFEMHVRDGYPGMPPSTPDLMRNLSATLEKLDPSLSATYVARASVQYMDWQFEEAKKSWEKAIRLNQNNEFAHTSYGFALTRWGDSSNALKHLWKAAALEPSKGVIQQILGDPYFLRRDYTNAILQYRKGLRFTPDNVAAHNRIGRVLQAMHKYPEAIEEFEMVALTRGTDGAKTKESFDQLRAALRTNGEKGYWQEQLRRTDAKPDLEFYRKAVIHVHLGHTNDVFLWLNKSFETREEESDGLHHQLNRLLFDEYWDGLRGDPRFKKLLKDVGFPRN